MAPKKKVVDDTKGPWMLGKFSTHLKVGLVGPPNVGKSTLYNSLSKSHHSEAANYPFCTIDPTETRVQVDDDRFDWLVEMRQPKASIKPFVTIVDIAGLIKGASTGAGLGNAFLSHINAVDGIIHVMRAFEDADVIHHDDKPNPVADIEMITSELRIKDVSYLGILRDAHCRKKQGAVTSGGPGALKAWEEEKAGMDKFIEYLEGGKDIRNGLDIWSTKEIEYLNEYKLLTAKPVMFAVNLSFNDFKRKKNKFLKPIFEWVNENAPGSAIIPYSGSYEEELQELDAAACKAKELEDEVQSALPRMIRNAFTMVNLIYYFTYGPLEVRSWIIRKGMKAPQAGAVIHNDFEKAFIMAEVMAFADLKELGTEIKVKEAGKYRQEGKNYEVKDGDVITFKVGQITEKKK